MNKNTIVYGLLIAGGLLAYYAWKNEKTNAEKAKEEATSLGSGTFVDDVPVSPDVLGIKNPKKTLIQQVKNKTSSIVEPLIGKKQLTKLSGKAEFLEP